MHMMLTHSAPPTCPTPHQCQTAQHPPVHQVGHKVGFVLRQPHLLQPAHHPHVVQSSLRTGHIRQGILAQTDRQTDRQTHMHSRSEALAFPATPRTRAEEGKLNNTSCLWDTLTLLSDSRGARCPLTLLSDSRGARCPLTLHLTAEGQYTLSHSYNKVSSF